MSTVKQLTVVSSNVTSKGNYCNKLKTETINKVATPFGDAVSKHQETYYLFTERQNQINTVGSLDIANFTVVDKPFTITKEDGTLENITLKYLYPKI